MIEPLGTRVLLLPIDEKIKAGNLIVPDLGKEAIVKAEVVSTGPGRMSEYGHTIHTDLIKGDKVLLLKATAREVVYGDTTYYLVESKEILAISK
jgi:chaperonin GroES